MPGTASPVTETKVAGTEASPKDVKATERLNRYWTEGAGAAKIRWGVPGDFKRCVRLMTKYMPGKPEQVKGHCANLHKRATGGWPGHAPGVESAEAAAKKAAEHKAAVGVAERAGKTLAEILDLSTLVDDTETPDEPTVIEAAALPEIETEMPSPFDEGVTLLFGADGSLIARDADGALTLVVEATAQEEIDALPPVVDPEYVDVDLDAVVDETPTPEDEDPPEGTEPVDEPPAGTETEDEDLAGEGTKGLLTALDLLSTGWDDGLVTETKKAFSASKREELAKSGHALPDGSFPIENEDDLTNAVSAIGRAGKKGTARYEKVRAHICKRAKALGATDKLPEDMTAESKALETKGAFPYMEGSAEARSALVERAIRDALIPEPEPGQISNVWVSVFGTFPDRVYCTVNDYSGGKEDTQSYEIAYVIGDDEDVTLGVPAPVEKEIAVTASDDSGADEATLPLQGMGLAVKSLQDSLASGGRLTVAQHKSLQAAHAALSRALVGTDAPVDLTSGGTAETEPLDGPGSKSLADGQAFISEAEILAARSTYADLV